MTKNMKKMSVAAVAGASSLSLLASHAAHAALTITWTETPNVSTQDGTMDKYVFNITAITGGDAVAGPAGQDPEVLLMEGTWTDPTGVILVPGAAANAALGPWTQYIASPNTSEIAVPTGMKSSSVNLPGLFGTQTRSGTGTAGTVSTAVTSIHGTSATFTGHWLQNNPGTGAGPGGGIEPSVNSGRMAVIWATPGTSLSFIGDYGTYQTVGGQAITSPVTVNTGSIVTTPTTHNIVNLTSATQAGGSYGVQLTSGTGANQATFAPNAPVAGTINVTKVGANSYVPGFANGVSGATAGTGAIADFAQISGFAAGDQEIYALKMLVGGTAPTTTQMNSIVADIGGQSGDGVSTVASLLGSPSGLAGQIAGLFPGYDLMLTVTTGTATPFLGFDFSQETNVAGVVVTNIAAVPEPASAAILLIGSSLLLGRRKRTAMLDA